MFSVIVNAVITRDNKVLVSKRSFKEKHEPGKWTIPGGKIDVPKEEIFEIIEKTLIREVEEEIGIIVEPITLITNNTFTRSNGDAVLALVFLCKYISGVPKPLEDTIDCKWVSQEEIVDMEFPPNVKEYILKGFKTS